MVQRLPYPDERENPHPRDDLDRDLEVALWATPAVGRAPYADAPIEPGAPVWWHGDEEASQSFLKAVGIDPTTLGG